MRRVAATRAYLITIKADQLALQQFIKMSLYRKGPRSRVVRGQACRRSARSSRRGLLDARPRIVLCRGCQGGRGRAAVGARGVTGPPSGGKNRQKLTVVRAGLPCVCFRWRAHSWTAPSREDTVMKLHPRSAARSLVFAGV